MRIVNLFAIVALGTLGCALNPAPVAISADPEGRALVLGDWSGTYYTTDGGRAGSIVFQFHQHDSTGIECFGDVVMSLPTNRQYPSGEESGISAPEETVQLLIIDFVRVTGHEVSGTMAPYRDPDTGEMLSTTFEGWIDGDKISGKLITVHSGSGKEEVGSWEISRK